MSRSILGVLSLILFAVGAFYAFNAYIQQRERGFVEVFDVPIAVLGILSGAVLALLASRSRAL
ncbi:MAG TPA: hypothetical protein VFV20_07060 [Candidatus Limnocylindria bacterium]|nr:hypothetical protein [Candidatus Limnocylindria bacterium]